ncbi:MAG: PLP-dependent aminotransferase family protein [Kiritimatiellia bacterium]
MKNYLRLYESLKAAIRDGGYTHGAKLPSKRALARERGVSLVTVEHAYRLLCDDGYAESRERSGYFVMYGLSRDRPRARPAAPIAFHPKANAHRVPASFPFSVFAATLRGVVARYGERLLIKSPNMGTEEARGAIAAYLMRARGLCVKPSQIVIGSGAEYLYGLLAQMFGGGEVGIEDPSYARIREVYEAHGVRVRRLRLGARGIVSAALERMRGGVLHVTPYRSYPTGVTADASKRREYVRWAQTHGGLLVEDDFGSEFAAGRAGAETLYELDGGGHVVYLNTFSKTIAPSMRIGYMVLPERLLKAYASSVGFYSCPVPVFDQLFLADFLNGGAFERYLNRLRREMKRTIGG